MASPLPLPHFFTLSGQRSPGISRLSGGAVPREWQEQKGTATDGNSLRYMGAPLQEFQAEIELTTPQHVEDWKTFRPLVDKPKPGVQPPAYDFGHPLTDDIGITKVIVVDRSMLEEKDPGRWVTVVKFKSYRKPKPIVSKPTSVENAKGDPPAAETSLGRQVREATAAFEKEAAKAGLLPGSGDGEG